MVRGEDALGVHHDEASRRVAEGDLNLRDRRAFRPRGFIGLAQKFDLLRLVDATRFNPRR